MPIPPFAKTTATHQPPSHSQLGTSVRFPEMISVWITWGKWWTIHLQKMLKFSLILPEPRPEAATWGPQGAAVRRMINRTVGDPNRSQSSKIPIEFGQCNHHMPKNPSNHRIIIVILDHIELYHSSTMGKKKNASLHAHPDLTALTCAAPFYGGTKIGKPQKNVDLFSLDPQISGFLMISDLSMQ